MATITNVHGSCKSFRWVSDGFPTGGTYRAQYMRYPPEVSDGFPTQPFSRARQDAQQPCKSQLQYSVDTHSMKQARNVPTLNAKYNFFFRGIWEITIAVRRYFMECKNRSLSALEIQPTINFGWSPLISTVILFFEQRGTGNCGHLFPSPLMATHPWFWRFCSIPRRQVSTSSSLGRGLCQRFP